MASQERVTAAVLIIGDEILSGRTQDTNLNAIARTLLDDLIQSPGRPILAELENQLVLQAYEHTGQQTAAAARLLGLTPALMAKKLKAAQSAP